MNARLNLIRANDIRGLPVVTIDGGEDAAEIRDIVYDCADHHLIGFTLNKRGWFRGTLAATLLAEDVEGIGRDAVMVASERHLTHPGDTATPLDDDGKHVDVIGDEVISASGSVIGRVVDVILETGRSPRAVGYEIESDGDSLFIPSSAQMSVSNDHLMVPAEAEEFFRDDLAGFGGAVESFRTLLSRGGPS